MKLTFTATLPAGATTIEFRALQYYDNGDIVRWIDPTPPGGPEPDHPAPVLTIGATADEDHHAEEGTDSSAADDHDEASSTSDSSDDSNGTVIAVIVIAVIVIAAGGGAFFYVRSRRRRSFQPLRSHLAPGRPGRGRHRGHLAARPGGWAASCPSARNRSRRRASTCGRSSGTRGLGPSEAATGARADLLADRAFAFSDPQPLTGAVFTSSRRLGIGATVAYALILLGALH